MSPTQIIREADLVGITSLPVFRLYAQPRYLSEFLGKYITDIVIALQQYFEAVDPDFAFAGSGGTKNTSYYFLLIRNHLFVEVINKLAGVTLGKPTDKVKHIVTEINIYSEDDKIIREIAEWVDDLYDDGILNNLNWKRIEKKFGIDREDCITNWNRFTSNRKQVRGQAEELGITDFPAIILHAQPTRTRETYSMWIPDLVDIIYLYLRQEDQKTAIERRSLKWTGSHNRYYILSPRTRLFVEVEQRIAGLNQGKASNSMLQITIHSEVYEQVSQIAKLLNGQFIMGFLMHVDWSRIEKKFKVKREDCIATWNALLQY